MQEIKIENDMLIVGGRGVRLTKDQLEHLGFKENLFDLDYGDKYFYIDQYGDVKSAENHNESVDKLRWEVGNACRNEELMKQRALQETLSRLLWKFSLENGGDEINWRSSCQKKWGIYYDHFCDEFKPHDYTSFKTNTTYFISEEVAQRAINEVIKPFIEENPEFRW